jgi:hypothetical protein
MFVDSEYGAYKSKIGCLKRVTFENGICVHLNPEFRADETGQNKGASWPDRLKHLELRPCNISKIGIIS